jgi:hypothetical protein
MPSPFAGMDPYLEQFWRDVHASLIIYARDQLQSQLPGDLRARVEERVVVEERSEPMTETFIEILDVGSGKRVVTVIEVLSLTNKFPGEGMEQYQRKQRELKDGGVSLVEIDLLRSGKHVLAVPRNRIPERGRTAYKVCVRRGWQADTWELYPLPLRAKLPTIMIPLRQTDADIRLDLQALIEQCYKNGGYEDDLDYRAEPDPPLDPDDAGWADEVLRAAGKR